MHYYYYHHHHTCEEKPDKIINQDSMLDPFVYQLHQNSYEQLDRFFDPVLTCTFQYHP
jgi:hypothetical protein